MIWGVALCHLQANSRLVIPVSCIREPVRGLDAPHPILFPTKAEGKQQKEPKCEGPCWRGGRQLSWSDSSLAQPSLLSQLESQGADECFSVSLCHSAFYINKISI